MKRIHLSYTPPNGRNVDIDLSGDHVTTDMLNVAEVLVMTLQGQLTGDAVRLLCTRAPSLYEACAAAFGTTREDAKQRLLAAMYGNPSPAPTPEPLLIGWTWRAQLDDLHQDVRTKRWMHAARTLVLMLDHTLAESMKAGAT